MAGGEFDHEHAQVTRFAGARRSLEEREARAAFHQCLDKLVVPVREFLAVEQVEVSLLRSRIDDNLHALGPEASVGGVDDLK